MHVYSSVCHDGTFIPLVWFLQVYLGNWRGTQVAIKQVLSSDLELETQEARTRALTMSSPVFEGLKKVSTGAGQGREDQGYASIGSYKCSFYYPRSRLVCMSHPTPPATHPQTHSRTQPAKKDKT